jgi:threonine/homoserine/homoserine lactone efflux protein
VICIAHYVIDHATRGTYHVERMDASFLFRGLVIGFSIAAPVGPIGVLCIRRTLVEGRAAGLASGLGAATADAMYGSIAGFGLTFISGLLIGQQTWLRLIGGAFLCYLGLRTFLAAPAPLAGAASVKGNGLVSAYASTFFLTLTNPMTILSFAAVFAGLGLANASGSYFPAGILVLGVFIGSALWWLLLSGGVGLIRDRFNALRLQWVNRISGIIITGFGVLALLSLGGF